MRAIPRDVDPWAGSGHGALTEGSSARLDFTRYRAHGALLRPGCASTGMVWHLRRLDGDGIRAGWR